MKHKILLLAISVFSAAAVHAGNQGPCNGPGKGVDEVNGSVVDAQTKKPLKDVVITAYISSKKEKYVLTDDGGRYGFQDLKPGTYKIVFEREGYRKVTKEKVIVKTDETFQMNIEMIEAGNVDIMPSAYHFMDTR